MVAVLLLLAAGLVPGERLEYDVKYGPFTLGQLVLETLAPDTIADAGCHHFRSTLGLNLGFVFKAEYEIESWARARDMVTMRSAKTTRESRFQGEWTADFDYDSSRVFYSDGEVYVLRQPEARDLLTLWHWFRSLPLDTGELVPVYAHTDRREYDTWFRATRRTEVSTPAGRFESLELVPEDKTPLGAVYLADASVVQGGYPVSSGMWDEEFIDRVPVLIKTKVGAMEVSAFLRDADFGPCGLEGPDSSDTERSAADRPADPTEEGSGGE
ncbi:MAG: DUF3108 domain-containing protein [candidate division WOR-3 bacterium]|nr:MAG: DUF3108 domain-containing protein [candidate division WOR-3 bacterium]